LLCQAAQLEHCTLGAFLNLRVVRPGQPAGELAGQALRAPRLRRQLPQVGLQHQHQALGAHRADLLHLREHQGQNYGAAGGRRLYASYGRSGQADAPQLRPMRRILQAPTHSCYDLVRCRAAYGIGALRTICSAMWWCVTVCLHKTGPVPLRLRICGASMTSDTYKYKALAQPMPDIRHQSHSSLRLIRIHCLLARLHLLRALPPVRTHATACAPY